MLRLIVTRLIPAAGLIAGIAAAADHLGVVHSGGLPIPGATITAVQGEARHLASTDELGRYQLPDVGSGSWSVTVEAFGFEPQTRAITLPGDRQANWEIQLAAPAAAEPRERRGEEGFERRLLNRTAQQEVMAAVESAGAAAPVASASMVRDANESFLVSGTLSRGLQFEPEMVRAMMRGGFRGGPGGGGSANPTAPGFGSDGGGLPGDPGGGPPGGPGGGPPGGFGGPGGPGGARGGFFRGPGGRPGGGPPGGGREGRRGRPEWMGRRGVAAFGNRRFRGQNSFRGRAFFSMNNSAFDARQYSINGQEIDKSPYAQYRFGVSLGGNLRIPKLFESENTFLFFNYSGSRTKNPFNGTATVPTAAELAGDFSSSVAQGPVSIFDPTTGQPFPGNVVPSARIDPAAQGLLGFIPQPNSTGAVQNYQFVTSVPRNTDNLGTRVSHTLSRRDSLSGSFNLQRRASEAATLYGYRDETDGAGLSASLGWTRSISSTLINSLRVSFSRNRTEVIPEFASGPDVAGELGILGTSQAPEDYGPPSLSFTNFGALSAANASLRRDQSTSVSESVTWIRGDHNLRFGFDYRRNQYNSRVNEDGRGSFSFSGLITSDFDDAGNPLSGTGFDLADMMLGFAQTAAVRFGESALYFRGSSYSAHVQDDYRVTANFSLNIGIRYEYTQPLYEKFGRMSNLIADPGFTGVTVVTPETSGVPMGLVSPDKNNIGPRIGLAWRPWKEKSLRVRAGYGIYYNGSVYNQMANRLGQQPPFATATTLTTSITNPLTLTTGLLGSPTTEINNTLAVAGDYMVGYAQTWNLSLQQDLPLALMLEIGYLGTKGTRLDIQSLPNQAPPGSPVDSEDRRPIPNAVGFTYESSDGNSIYHAGQVRLMRRFRRGLSFHFLYTYAKSIDNVSTYGGGQAVVVQNSENLAAERGRSSFDQRHALSINFMASSPVGQGPSTLRVGGVWGKLLENWMLNGGVTAHSGTPLTAMALGNRSDAGGTGVVGSGRADATGLSVSSGTGYFNTAAFAVPAADTYGNAGRNTIPGPKFFVLNTSLGRSFRIGSERRRMEFRVEANNVLNSVNITRLGTTVNASNFGLATGASSMRTISAQVSFRF